MNSNGLIYGGVSIDDVNAVLGIKAKSVAAACKSKKINPKAACKPNSYQTYTSLEAWERKATNYSIAIRSYSNPVELVRGVLNKNAYLYSIPDANFRLLDFKGYNHNATNWVTYNAGNVPSVGKSCPIELSGNGDALSAGLLALTDLLSLGYLSKFAESNIQFGFILKDSRMTEAIASCYWVPITGALTVRDIVDNGKLSIPASAFTAAGVWEILPCFTTARFEQNSRNYISSDYNNGQWLPIPYCQILTIDVQESATVYPVDSIALSLQSADAAITRDGVVTLSNVYVSVANDSAESARVVVDKAIVKSGVIGGAVQLDGGSVTIPGKSSASVALQSSPVQFLVADPSIERLAIEIEYYADSASAQRRTQVLYIENINAN